MEDVVAADAAANAPVPTPRALTQKQLKGKIQEGVQRHVDDFWKEKVGHYIMQGDYLALMEENSCITWKSYLWDIPQGVLKFAINAGINTLPTFDNLKRWGKRVIDRCPFCGNIQTLAHVLSNCSSALDQGRFTWRHNSVLRSFIDVFASRLKSDVVFFSDLDGFQAPHGGTIPPDILVTSFRPDLFFIDRTRRRIALLELTCPWDSNVNRSHEFKENKYAPLVADLSHNYKVFQFSVEVTVRGQISKENKSRLKCFAYEFCSDSKNVFKLLVKNGSKAALLGSYSLFSARNEPSWTAPRLLITR